MSLKNILKGGAASFAHFAGIGTTAAKKGGEDEGDEMNHAEAEEPEEEAAAPEGGEDDKKNKKGKTKKGEGEAAASTSDDDEDEDEDEDEDDEGDDDKDAKAAKAAKAEFRRGRAAERERCAQIFGNEAAARNAQLACSLAFTTNLSAKAAIAILESAPAPRAGLHDRMDRGSPPRTPVGGSSELKGEAAISASWDTAFAAVTPKT